MAVPRGCYVVVRRGSTDDGPVPVVHVVRHAGESVLGATRRALREAGLTGAEPWAVDLSGRVAVLAVEAPAGMVLDHLPRDRGDEAVALAATMPEVRPSFREVVAPGAPDPPEARAADGRWWAVEADGRQVGSVQVRAEGDVVVVDVVPGDPGLWVRGSGTRMLWQLLLDVVRPQHPAATTYRAVLSRPDPEVLRMLGSLGFEPGPGSDRSLDVRRVLGRPQQPAPEEARPVTSG